MTCNETLVLENFDGDATTDQLDPTWKAQVDQNRLSRLNSHV